MAIERAGENGSMILSDLDRLQHALDANANQFLPVIETKKWGVSQGGKVVSEGEEEVTTHLFTPRRLIKLRAHVIESLRGEMALLGAEDLADQLIFPSEADVFRADGEDCDGK